MYTVCVHAMCACMRAYISCHVMGRVYPTHSMHCIPATTDTNNATHNIATVVCLCVCAFVCPACHKRLMSSNSKDKRRTLHTNAGLYAPVKKDTPQATITGADIVAQLCHSASPVDTRSLFLTFIFFLFFGEDKMSGAASLQIVKRNLALVLGYQVGAVMFARVFARGRSCFV